MNIVFTGIFVGLYFRLKYITRILFGVLPEENYLTQF